MIRPELGRGRVTKIKTLSTLKFHTLMERKMKATSHVKSIVKAISWRAVGAVDTFMLGWLVTGHLGMAGSIMGFEVLTKTFLYYGHERVHEFVWKGSTA